MTRAMWVAWGLLLAAVVATVILAVVIHNKDKNASVQRHELCVQIEKVKRAERQLWLGVIKRSPDADPKQVREFRRDLFRFFPPQPCK